MSDIELLAQTMLKHGLATGHGDTIADLCMELDSSLNASRTMRHELIIERDQLQARVDGLVEALVYVESYLDEAVKDERDYGLHTPLHNLLMDVRAKLAKAQEG